MTMIYEAEIEQTVMGKLFIEADNLEQAKQVAERCVQEAFVKWLDDNGYPRFRVPNETYTRSWSQKAKNKKLGVSSGVPDLFVVVPADYSDATMEFIHYGDNPVVSGDGVYGKNHRLVAIEMKRRKGGVTSANQKQWIKTLNEAGIQTVVCKGCDAAIEFIESITKP